MYQLNEPVRTKTAKGYVSGKIWTISYTSPRKYDILPPEGVNHVVSNVAEHNIEKEIV